MKPLIGFTLMFVVCLPQFAQVRLPPYTREVLPNGAVVALIPRTGVPLVHFHVLMKGGSESDPPQMAGLAEDWTESETQRQQVEAWLAE